MHLVFFSLTEPCRSGRKPLSNLFHKPWNQYSMTACKHGTLKLSSWVKKKSFSYLLNLVLILYLSSQRYQHSFLQKTKVYCSSFETLNRHRQPMVEDDSLKRKRNCTREDSLFGLKVNGLSELKKYL